MRPDVSLRLLLVLGSLALGPPAAAGGPGRPTADPVGVWPLDPQPAVVQPFDPPAGPYGAGHRGVDLLGSVGQPVRSALPGTVSFTGTIAGVGVVVVGHGATRTTYQPVASGVAVGAVVPAGGTLGSLQAGGSHCPPRACLHWGWVAGETYLDPLRLVGAGPVRLLPLGGSTAVPVAALRGTPVAAFAPALLAAAGTGQARGWAWR
jgi:murein DD-endopeptidase MepM/ murein hydrolase activator NlpD